MLGLVEAGFPSAAEEELLDVMDFDEFLTPNKESSYILKVKGDSMIDAGLMPGDTVVVEKANTADDGAIVVALVDDAYTIKRLVRENRKYVLKPENKAYPVLRPDSLEIVGVVVGSFRKYK